MDWRDSSYFQFPSPGVLLPAWIFSDKCCSFTLRYINFFLTNVIFIVSSGIWGCRFYYRGLCDGSCCCCCCCSFGGGSGSRCCRCCGGGCSSCSCGRCRCC